MMTIVKMKVDLAEITSLAERIVEESKQNFADNADGTMLHGQWSGRVAQNVSRRVFVCVSSHWQPHAPICISRLVACLIVSLWLLLCYVLVLVMWCAVCVVGAAKTLEGWVQILFIFAQASPDHSAWQTR